MFKHILVCTDGSKLSDKAVDAAIRLAKDFGARLTAFHATQDYPANAYAEYALVAGSITPKQWADEQKKRAQQVLGKVEARAKKNNLKCDSRFGTNTDPHTAILAAAKKFRCDLIVMASHGRRGIQSLILGSETNKVLTHGKLPVLVYR